VESTLVKVIHKGEIVGVNKVNVGDFVIFVQDFMTKGIIPEWPQEVIAPAGTKGWVVSITDGEPRVDLAGSGDSCFVDDVDIIEPFEPDEFDRAWLSHDYEAARRIWDNKGA
jgi:hypothetical protein